MKTVTGILETYRKGFGFVRSGGEADVYIDKALINGYHLKSEDEITCEVKEEDGSLKPTKILRINDKDVSDQDLNEVRKAAILEDRTKQKEVYGVLEVLDDGFGFLRANNYLSGSDDIFISESKINSLRLRTGDMIHGMADASTTNGQQPLDKVLDVNGHTIQESLQRKRFDHLTPIFPNEKIKMETDPHNSIGRIIDLFAPVGKGQRGLIVAPPKAGKTTLLESIAQSILENNKKLHLIVLLIDERPEEVTAFKEMVESKAKDGQHVEVIYSTFDEKPSHHKRVAEMTVARAKSLVEFGEDVVVLLDSITRLSRAYNLIVPSTGKVLSGGLDPNALYGPKKLFGAARNLREGGSLTVLATALVDTGSRMDDMIFEEFKGTGNMELYLDKSMAERRVFPAINLVRSSTRHDDLLQDEPTHQLQENLRFNYLSKNPMEDMESILKTFRSVSTNDQIIDLFSAKKKSRV